MTNAFILYDLLWKVQTNHAANTEGSFNAPHALFVFLAQVYYAMIVHIMCPESMIIGTMISIPKVKRQVVCNSDNVWEDFRLDHFNERKWQLVLVNEIINYYNCNKTNVHMLFLDANKVFDIVRYCKLFKCLLKHNLLPRILHLLSVKYMQQMLHVIKMEVKNQQLFQCF